MEYPKIELMWEKLIYRFRKLVHPASPEQWQREIIEKVKPFTMTSDENILALINAVGHIVNNKVEGDLAECGVWKGGSMMAAALTLFHLGETERKIYLYDTFAQFPSPEKVDVTYAGESGTSVLESLGENGLQWTAPDEEEVKDNMYSTGYPKENFFFIKGQVEETIPAKMPEQIALLRLDTDWYQSTRHELKWLYPQLSKNGVLIIDDYGYWKGCKKAVDEFLKEENISAKLIPVDFSARMLYKD